MILPLVIEGREAHVCMLASLHGAHHYFVVLLEESTLHLELLIDLASLTKVYELAIIVARLMPIVNIISVLDQGAFSLNKHKLQYGVFIDNAINKVLIIDSFDLSSG
jgi:hypothetical protein